MTVARGMGGEESVGCVANGHMTVGRWGGGGGGGGGVRPSSPPSIKPMGWPRALKKKILARPVDCQWAYRPGPNRAVGLT